MARTPLSLGQHGNIATAPNSHASSAKGNDQWHATCRMNDPKRGKVVQVRAYGGTREEAVLKLEATIEKRRDYIATAVPSPECKTVGELLDWWWVSVAPKQQYSESTLTNFMYAIKRVQRAEISSVAFSMEEADAVLASTSAQLSMTRTDRIAGVAIRLAVSEYQAAYRTA